MGEFIHEHFNSIVTVLVCLVVLGVLILLTKSKYSAVAKRILLSLVVAAEEKYGGGTGEIKFSYVAEKLHDKLPLLAQLVLTERDISSLIEDAVTRMKDYLSESTIAVNAVWNEDNNE